jgi:REP element-mobilizing transposase RayT
VAGGVVLPSEAGEIVSNLWKDLPRRFPAVELDAFVVMPNHLHGILWLGGAKPDADSERVVPLGEVLRTFKALSARSVRTRPMPQFGWQRNYYEHVVRDEADLARIRQYIQDNPIRWDLDHENPAQLRRLR